MGMNATECWRNGRLSALLFHYSNVNCTRAGNFVLLCTGIFAEPRTIPAHRRLQNICWTFLSRARHNTSFKPPIPAQGKWYCVIIWEFQTASGCPVGIPHCSPWLQVAAFPQDPNGISSPQRPRPACSESASSFCPSWGCSRSFSSLAPWACWERSLFSALRKPRRPEGPGCLQSGEEQGLRQPTYHLSQILSNQFAERSPPTAESEGTNRLPRYSTQKTTQHQAKRLYCWRWRPNSKRFPNGANAPPSVRKREGSAF